MRTRTAPQVIDDATAIRERWRAASMSSVWLRPGDWYVPEVEAVTDAFAEDRDPTAALERLGRARSKAGVGLRETLDDLICLFQVSGRSQAPWTNVRVVAEAWSEALLESTVAAPLLDPSSALVTPEYLMLRLKEVYAEVKWAGGAIGEHYCLVVVDTAVGEVDQWRQMQRSFVLSASLEEVFTHGETMSVTKSGSGRVIVLAKRDATLTESLSHLRESLMDNMDDLYRAQAVRQPARIWIESLPGDYDLALALLNGLTR